MERPARKTVQLILDLLILQTCSYAHHFLYNTIKWSSASGQSCRSELYSCNEWNGASNDSLLYNTLFSREENFAKSEFEIFSREDIFANILFTRKYLPAKISSHENILSRKYLPAKISSRENIFPRFFSVPQIGLCRLVRHRLCGISYYSVTYR